MYVLNTYNCQYTQIYNHEQMLDRFSPNHLEDIFYKIPDPNYQVNLDIKKEKAEARNWISNSRIKWCHKN